MRGWKGRGFSWSELIQNPGRSTISFHPPFYSLPSRHRRVNKGGKDSCPFTLGIRRGGGWGKGIWPTKSGDLADTERGWTSEITICDFKDRRNRSQSAAGSRLNQAAKGNYKRLPDQFAFQLAHQELRCLKSHNAISSYPSGIPHTAAIRARSQNLLTTAHIRGRFTLTGSMRFHQIGLFLGFSGLQGTWVRRSLKRSL